MPSEPISIPAMLDGAGCPSPYLLSYGDSSQEKVRRSVSFLVTCAEVSCTRYCCCGVAHDGESGVDVVGVVGEKM